MRKLYRPMLLSLMCFLLAPAAAGAAPPCKHLVATGNPEYPPYLWRDPQNPQRLIGANADLLQRLGSELGLEIDVVYGGPWSRAQEQVKSGRIDLIAGAFRTASREVTMDFIPPPFLNTPSVVWVRHHDPFSYTGWADLQGRSGGTLVNNSYGQQFDDYANAHLKLEAVPSADQAFRKLLFKRNDYVIYELYPGLALARTLGISQQVQALAPPVSSEGLYLTLSHHSACNQPELRAQLAQKLTDLLDRAVPRQLLEQNLKRWQDQQARSGTTGKP